MWWDQLWCQTKHNTCDPITHTHATATVVSTLLFELRNYSNVTINVSLHVSISVWRPSVSISHWSINRLSPTLSLSFSFSLFLLLISIHFSWEISYSYSYSLIVITSMRQWRWVEPLHHILYLNSATLDRNYSYTPLLLSTDQWLLLPLSCHHRIESYSDPPMHSCRKKEED